jgi:spore coat polysaccharide biosynthesis protein SpsF
MNKKFKTPQEEFWAGSFGSEYISRNTGSQLLASNVKFFSRALRSAGKIGSCVEFGANIGMNARALKILYPALDVHGVEINQDAADQLAEVVGEDRVYRDSILEFTPPRQWDVALIKGVLIHINPEMLINVYDRLVDASRRYILVAEYYNPSPVSISYRGNNDRLFKRDFAGEIMDRHPEVRLIDYGFSYHRDPVFPQDDVTWFLMEKVADKI